MKEYGANKSTEFTKKQINVLYAMNKQEKITISDRTMKQLYYLADYYGYDDGGSVEFEERFVLNILNSVFADEYKKAQEQINALEEHLDRVLVEKK